MFNETKKWFSQMLFYYEDKTYQTGGKLRISISTNSADDKNYNPPLFNISISHNFQKSCNINILQATDLLEAFKKVLSQDNYIDSEVIRRISSSIELITKFKLDQNEFPVVELILISSSTDFTKIIVPVDVFSVIAHRLKNYVNKYDDLCFKLLMNNINGEYIDIIKQLPGLIKGISSQIIPNDFSDNISDRKETVPNDIEEIPSEQTIKDLDEFLGNEMKNIKIPEIENKKIDVDKTINVVHSDFLEKILENDLSNIENILVNVDSSKNPIMDLNDSFIKNIEKDINYLPNLEGEEIKSICYISKLLCSVITQSHIKFGAHIPVSTPILKYKVTEYKDENLELAYDIILFIAYIRNLRNRLADKLDDFIENKSRLYLQMRCFLDPFCLSFLEKVDKSQIKSIINNRFNYYDSIGVFDKYKDILIKFNCPQVIETDINSFINEFNEEITDGSKFILDEHDRLRKTNNLRISSSNKFTLEQIINEVIPLEISEKLGKEITIENSSKNASVEVINYFLEQSTSKVEKSKKTKKRSNIERFTSQYRNEIPDKHRESFLNFIKENSHKDFIFKDSIFPLDEFGSNIIKGLYLWKPSSDPEIIKSYKYYFNQFEECLLEKDHILTIGLEETKVNEWTKAFDDMNFE